MSLRTALAFTLLLLVAGAGMAQEQTQTQAAGGRYFLLLFEIPKGKKVPGQYLEAAQRARKWLQQELRPDDWVAVMSYRGMLVLHQDLTRDREALSRAVGTVMAVMAGGKGEIPAATAGAPSLKLSGNLGVRAQTISGSLGLLGAAAKAIPGRKNLVLFTDGLDGDPVSKSIPGLNQAQVAVYPVDLGDGSSAGRQPLQALAEATGGRYIEHFWSALDQVSADSDRQ